MCKIHMINCSINTLKISINFKKTQCIVIFKNVIVCFLLLSGLNANKWSLIPLFHTGQESPESPRIDFFYTAGGGGDS